MPQSFDELFLDPHSQTSEDGTLSSKDAQQDIDVLVYALRTAYPAIWAMAPTAWTNIIDQLVNLNIPLNLTRRSFGEWVADALWPIPDGHLKVKFGTDTLGEKYRSNLRRPSTGMNISTGHVWKSETINTDRDRVPVIGISFFPQSSEPVWANFIENIKEIHSHRNAIFNLRGNRGGDDSKAIEAASILLGKTLSFEWLREVVCESPESYALQANTFSKIIWQSYDSKNLSPPLELEEKLASLKNRAASLRDTLPQKKVIEGAVSKNEITSPAFAGQIFALVDSNTASSGEWTALYLQQHPNTVIIGEKTAGMVHFGNSGLLRLPHSQLEITLCMKINEFVDGRFFEKVGITPNIVLQNQDSLEYVLSKM